MRKIFLGLIGASALAATSGAALAQSIGVEVYAGPRYGMGYGYGPGYYADDDVSYGYVATPRARTRVYGYVSEDAAPAPRTRGRGDCGTYFYWDGTSCVDARNRSSNQ